jgi:hypothetical protein
VPNILTDQSCQWEGNLVCERQSKDLNTIDHKRLVGWKNTLVLVPYGDRFREYRRYFHQLIGSRNSMKAFHPAEELETHIFLQKLLAKPADLAAHVRRCVILIIDRVSVLMGKLSTGRLALSSSEFRMAMNYKENMILLWTWPTEPPSNFPYPRPLAHSLLILCRS